MMGGQGVGHSSMVTCLDTFEYTLLSAGLDSNLLVRPNHKPSITNATRCRFEGAFEP